MLFDTDVLVWAFRGNPRAATTIEAAELRCLSVVTYMELMQGVRDRRELKNIKAFLVDLTFQMLPLTENIGHRATIYMEEFGLKVAMCVPDALIAATAVESQLPLCTANQKHYKPIGELEIKLFRP
jgi:predicted nucleic acid-binding protein